MREKWRGRIELQAACLLGIEGVRDKAWFEQDHPQFWPGNLATYSYQGQQYGFPIVGHPGSIQHYYNVDYLTKKGTGFKLNVDNRDQVMAMIQTRVKIANGAGP